MRRRSYLAALAGTAGAGLAGCLSREDGGSTTTGSRTQGKSESGRLRVATYQAFVEAPSSSPGDWVKREFESEFPDATLEWQTPEAGLNRYLRRRQSGGEVDADVYVGLNVDDLVRIDRELDEGLFEPTDRGVLSNAEHLRDELEFDPEGRAIPFDTGYISLVYDETAVDAPGTFDALLRPEYEDTLLAQNAQTSDPGRAFMLWTVAAKGPDGYLDYWEGLQDNGVRIFDSWSDAYGAYGEGERPIVVSYSTDQVYANRYDQDMSRHQVGFLNDQGYANPEGMAVFRSADNPGLGRTFLDWMLSETVQSEIPVRNVQFPATDHADLGEEFSQFAYEPPEPVTFGYDELAGNLGTWTEQWARRIVGN